MKRAWQGGMKWLALRPDAKAERRQAPELRFAALGSADKHHPRVSIKMR
jgi:hypothetical protein